MKKLLVIAVLAAALAIIPSLVFAGYDEGDGYELLTRLEVSKDGSTWINYSAETNSGNQTLTVSPGDTIFLRLKTWDIGQSPATNIQFSSTFTNPTNIDAFDPFTSGNDDSDGDGLLFYSAVSVNINAGTFLFSLDGVAGNTNENAGYQSGTVAARIGANAPNGSITLITVQITDADHPVAYKINQLFPRAYADEQGATQIRLLVYNPTDEDDPVYHNGKGL
jgi:hypothetical protein